MDGSGVICESPLGRRKRTTLTAAVLLLLILKLVSISFTVYIGEFVGQHNARQKPKLE